jgi:hypothetical protein
MRSTDGKVTEDMAGSEGKAPDRTRGRFALLAGFGLAILGIFAFVAQLGRQRLTIPWYMPALAALGVILAVVSLRERRTVGRIIGLSALLLLTGAELALLYAMRLPPYTGPIAVGQAFPAFEAKLADGTLFTQRDLRGEQNNVLVFFRGRW